MPQHPQSTDGFIFSLLGGKIPAWPATASTAFADGLQQELRLQGLYPLVYHLCKSAPAWKTWPAGIRERAKKTAFQQAAWDLAVESRTRHLLTRLQASGIYPIVLKGSAIAYTHYQRHGARTRGDIDLLFSPRDLPAAFRILEAEGYEYTHRQGYLGQELGFHDTSPGQKNLPLDIHWRSSSYVLLAHLLDYEEIIDSAIRIPELADHPCAMNPVHALLHACIHWAKHAASGDSIRTLWLYDMYLLAGALTEGEMQQFIQSATDKKITRICAAAIAAVKQTLTCKALETLHHELRQIRQQEPSARMLEHHAASFALRDMWSLENSAMLQKSLQDILLPPGAYVLKFYGRENRLWLPFLYAHRVSAGLIEYARRGFGIER
ncbi:nucleotidyltransferase family protein [Thiolapillus sp.]